MLKNYVSKIHELEGELLQLKNLNNTKHRLIDCGDSDDEDFHPKNGLFPSSNEYSSDYDSKGGDISGNIWKALLNLFDFIDQGFIYPRTQYFGAYFY